MSQPSLSQRCPACGYSTALWLDYVCPQCGAFHAHLYRREHAHPSAARRMSVESIRREYAAVGRVPEAVLCRAPRPPRSA